MENADVLKFETADGAADLFPHADITQKILQMLNIRAAIVPRPVMPCPMPGD